MDTSKIDDGFVAVPKQPVARIDRDPLLLAHRTAPSRLAADSTHACSSVASLRREGAAEGIIDKCDDSVSPSAISPSTKNCSGVNEHVRLACAGNALTNNGFAEIQPKSSLKHSKRIVIGAATTKNSKGYEASIKGRVGFSSGPICAETCDNNVRYVPARGFALEAAAHPQADVRDAAGDGSALADCPRCGAQCAEGIDCLEAESCAAEPDWMLFAPYQPCHGQAYDVGNPFDRTNLGIRITAAIESRESFIALNERLYLRGDKWESKYREDAEEALAQLRRHRRALFRLNEIGSY